MPNHVHILVEPLADTEIAAIVKRWKGAASKHINAALQRHGTLWQKNYYDTVIRNEAHYNNVLRYIRYNNSRGGIRSGEFIRR